MILYYQRRFKKEDLLGNHIRCPSYNVRPGYLSPGSGYYYSDIKMCEVQTRKEAFREINLFMEVNGLNTDNTSVYKRDGCTYISLWESYPNKDKMQILACFILSPDERNSTVYWLFNYSQRVETEVQPEEPDICYKRYINSKIGLYDRHGESMRVELNEDGTYGWVNPSLGGDG